MNVFMHILLLQISFVTRIRACSIWCLPGEHLCVADCDNRDCLGADCSGFRGCHQECPNGTFSWHFWPPGNIFVTILFKRHSCNIFYNFIKKSFRTFCKSFFYRGSMFRWSQDRGASLPKWRFMHQSKKQYWQRWGYEVPM